MIRRADARLRASIVINCSMMLSLIGCMTLHDVAVRPADALSRPHIDLAIGEMGTLELAQGDTKDLGDLFRKGDVGPPGEEHHSIAGDNVQFSPRFSWRPVSLRGAESSRGNHAAPCAPGRGHLLRRRR